MATGTTPTPAPTPAAGTGKSKKWWIIHVTAGVAAMALVIFGATKCSGEKSAREEGANDKSELVQARASLDSLTNAVRDARVVIGDLTDDNRAKADTIRVLRDSIVVLNDSLADVNGKLVDCRNSKRKPAKPAKPAKSTKTTTKTTKTTTKTTVVKREVVVPIKPDTIILVQQPATPRCGGVTNVELNQSQNSGAIVVGGAGCRTDIRLDNGSVNNGAIVVGDGNDVVVNTRESVIAADSLARARQIREVQFTTVFYKTK